MKNLPIKEKIFWTNFLSVMGVFIAVTLAIAYFGEDGASGFGLLDAYIITSAFCVLSLAVKIGQQYSNYEDINEKREKFLKKHNISIESFQKKYKDVTEIYYNFIRVSDYGEEDSYDIYEFVNEDGKKEVYTIGYKKNGKFDIYWEDIIASKNNKHGIVLPDGTELIDTNVDENNTKLINRKCSFCMSDVDRFVCVHNFSKNDGDYDAEWMEVCWKCKKVLYLDTSPKE